MKISKICIIVDKKIETDTVILAIGHSSRDTFEKIYEKGLLVEPKNFSVGVRIEHLQSEINKSQYGTITKLNLPSADYKLAYHLQMVDLVILFVCALVECYGFI